MKKALLYLLVPILAVSVLSSYGQESLDKYLALQVEAKAFKGSVFVQHKGEVLLDKAYGKAHAEFQIPNTPETKFLIGSLTKPFTAWAILKVFAKHDLSLESPLSSFGYTFPRSDSIHIQHLLNHSSGLKDYPDLIEAPTWERFGLMKKRKDELLEEVLELGFSFSPGEGFRYSNMGYILLGTILEKIDKKSFAEVIKEEILVPYGLDNTGIMANRDVVPNLASGYNSTPRISKKAVQIDYSLPFSSGNMYSTSRDIFSFWESMRKDPAIPSQWREKVFPKQGEKYGYGWAERTFFDHQAYGHNGRMSGFVASIAYIPQEELFLTFIANEDNTSLHGITRDLLAIVLNEPYELPLVKKLSPLTREAYEPYLGAYEISPGDTLKIFEEDDVFYLQETGQMRHEIFPFAEHRFFFSLLEFDLIFEEIIEGKANKLILRRKEWEIVAEKVD